MGITTTPNAPDLQSSDLETRKKKTAFFALSMVLGMLALGYASVPLYRIFCQVTGLGGTTQVAGEAQAAAVSTTSKPIQISFDSNVSPALPWSFKPEQHTDQIAVGARDMAIYLAENLSEQPITGTATFNVTPTQAGKYFVKVQCFCFTEQTLEPGQKVRMPVLYYVDPAILDDPDTKDIEEITLSYTFYPLDQDEKGS